MGCPIKRGLGKKGMDDKLMFTIWEVIVIFMVVIALTIAVKGIANNTTYWKRYHSSDLALITDLMLTNQGDYAVNYDMKDLRQNFMTRTLRIDKLVFQIFLKNDSYFVYTDSVDKDRFPQSYIFARNIDMRVINANTTQDYITLYKTGDTISMEQGISTPEISCPSTPTKGNLNERKFTAISMTNSLDSYSNYITTLLSVVGKGLDDNQKDLIIVLSGSSDSTTLYYDTSQEQKSEKMTCLVKRYLLEKYPEMPIKEKPYDASLETEPFISQRNEYNYWIVIKVKGTEVGTAELGDSIKKAIEEYYN